MRNVCRQDKELGEREPNRSFIISFITNGAALARCGDACTLSLHRRDLRRLLLELRLDKIVTRDELDELVLHFRREDGHGESEEGTGVARGEEARGEEARGEEDDDELILDQDGFCELFEFLTAPMDGGE